MRIFDANSLRSRLARLSANSRIVFAAACCERLLPNYVLFVKSASWGDSTVLREALDYIWHTVTSGNIDRGHVEELLERCDAIVPDSEAFSSDFTSAAIDAGAAIMETLKTLLDDSIDHIIDTASFCRDTVDMFIQIRDGLDFNNDPEFEEKIARDPLMQYELERQALVLEQLERHHELDSSIVDNIRDKSWNDGVGSLAIRET
jgi:uncharacterized protein